MSVPDSDLSNESLLIPRILVLCGKIKLKPNISTINYYSNNLHHLVLGMLLGAVELLQNLLLKNFYKPEDVPKTSVILMLVDLIPRIIFFPIFGRLVDKYGRKKMGVFAYIITAIGILFFPLPFTFSDSPELFPWLYIARVIYALGTSILLTIPLIGDYVEIADQGKAMGINTLLLCAGVVISGVLVPLLQKQMSILKIYPLLLAPIFFFGVLACASFKEGVDYYQDNANHPMLSQSNEYKPPEIGYFQTIVKIFKKRRWIKVGVIPSFLCGMSLGVACLPNYILSDLNQQKTLEMDPTQTLQIAFLIAVLVNLIFEILLDYIHNYIISFTVFLFGIASYSLLTEISQSSDAFMVPLATCFISCLGYRTIMNHWEYKYCPRLFRGHSYGIKMFVLALGMLFVILVSGFTNGIFTDYTEKNIVFYVLIGSNSLGLALFIIICIRGAKKNQDAIKKGKHRPSTKSLLSLAKASQQNEGVFTVEQIADDDNEGFSPLRER